MLDITTATSLDRRTWAAPSTFNVEQHLGVLSRSLITPEFDYTLVRYVQASVLDHWQLLLHDDCTTCLYSLSSNAASQLSRNKTGSERRIMKGPRTRSYLCSGDFHVAVHSSPLPSVISRC